MRSRAPLFGWDGSREHLAPPAKLGAIPQAKAVPKPVPKPKPRAKPSPKHQPQPEASAAARRVLSKLAFRRVVPNGVEVSELKAFLQEVKGRDGGSNGYYWFHQAQKKHRWPASDLFQHEQREYETSYSNKRRKTLGGSKPYYASRAVLLQMYKDMFGV